MIQNDPFSNFFDIPISSQSTLESSSSASLLDFSDSSSWGFSGQQIGSTESGTSNSVTPDPFSTDFFSTPTSTESVQVESKTLDPFESFGDFSMTTQPVSSDLLMDFSSSSFPLDTQPTTSAEEIVVENLEQIETVEKPKESVLAVALLTRQDTKKLDHLTRNRPKMKRTHTVSKAKPATDISVAEPLSSKPVLYFRLFGDVI